MTVQQWYNMIGQKDSVFDVQHPDRFKHATAVILCNILHLDSVTEKEELQEFCTLLKRDAGVTHAELDTSDKARLRSSIEEAAQVIKDELENDPVKMMEFMRMLNRFIMVDKCREDDYCIFEEVRELLFDQ